MTVYRDQYHDGAQFQKIAEQDGNAVCAWLDRDAGFRVPLDSFEDRVDSGRYEEVDE